VKSGRRPCAPMRGIRTWDGGDRWCTITIVSPCVVSRVHAGNWHELFKRSRQLSSGPQLHFVFSKIFNHPNFEIRISDLPDVQNSPNFAGQEFET
jgi:hypothetical protein